MLVQNLDKTFPDRYADYTQAALHSLISAGDRNALAALYDRTAPLAYRVAYGLIGDARLAADAVYDAFCEGWHAPGSYDPLRTSVTGWVIGLVAARAEPVAGRVAA